MSDSSPTKRRLKPHRRRHRRVGVFGTGLLPLLDVLFLLLIFLLLAASFDQRKALTVTLAQTGGEALEERVVEELVLVLHEDGRILLDGYPIEEEALRIYLAARPPEDRLRTVIIQGDRSASLGQSLALLTLLRDLGYRNCVFETAPAATVDAPSSE